MRLCSKTKHKIAPCNLLQWSTIIKLIIIGLQNFVVIMRPSVMNDEKVDQKISMWLVDRQMHLLAYRSLQYYRFCRTFKCKKDLFQVDRSTVDVKKETKLGYVCMNPKTNNSLLLWSFTMKPIPLKLFVRGALTRKLSLVYSVVLDTSQLLILNGIQQFVCQQEKTTKRVVSFSVTTMPGRIQHVELLNIVRIQKIYQLITFSCSRLFASSDYNHFKKLLMTFKTNIFTISASRWRKYFQNWFAHIQKCADLKGEYF